METSPSRPRREDLRLRPLGAEVDRLVAGLGPDPFLDLDRLHGVGTGGAREVWTCWLDEEPVGFLVLDPAPDRELDLTLGVAMAQRRRGLGARLLEFAALRAVELGLSSLRVQIDEGNRAGEAFFAAHGFEELPQGLTGHRVMGRRASA